MKTILSLIFVTLLFSFTGCVNLSNTINELPGYEFEELNYSRTGNITSTSLSATNAKIEEGILTIESVVVTHSNPVFGLNTSVKGLKRPARERSTPPAPKKEEPVEDKPKAPPKEDTSVN